MALSVRASRADVGDERLSLPLTQRRASEAAPSRPRDDLAKPLSGSQSFVGPSCSQRVRSHDHGDGGAVAGQRHLFACPHTVEDLGKGGSGLGDGHRRTHAVIVQQRTDLYNGLARRSTRVVALGSVAVLTPFDDYPIHQTPLPVAHPVGGDPNHYDRYFFNGYTGDLYFAVAMGLYPNRGVIDAAFSVVHDGIQRSVFASARMPKDPGETRVGPLRIEIVEPLRVNRVVVDAPDHDLGADLTYEARTAAFQEPRQTRHQGNRVVMDATRLTQWGTWSGALETGGQRIALDGAVRGTKDRSWGIRPVGDQPTMAPAASLPQIFFLWSPLHFDDECLHYMVFEDADGHRWFESGLVAPVIAGDTPTWGDEGTGEVLEGGDHAIRWAPGLRRSEAARLTLRRRGRQAETIDLEPILTFRMRGIGYLHPVWSHGKWHGEEAVGGEEYKVDDLDSLDPSSIHVQQVVRATWGERRGMGVLEQLAIGPHAPSGFTDLFDGAPA